MNFIFISILFNTLSLSFHVDLHDFILVDFQVRGSTPTAAPAAARSAISVRDMQRLLEQEPEPPVNLQHARWEHEQQLHYENMKVKPCFFY